MKTKLLALLLFAGSSLFAGTRVFIGVGVGAPARGYYAPPPPALYSYRAPVYTRPVIHGLADIGIRPDRDITGGPAIGPGRLTRAHAGMHRATTDIATIPAIGGAN